MTESDLSTFKKLFTDYFTHVVKNPNSFLARIYGIYTVTMDDMVPQHLILMGNTKKTYDNDRTLKYVFDLKGSMVNRETKCKKGQTLKNTTILKDKNILELMKTNDKVRVPYFTSYLVHQVLTQRSDGDHEEPEQGL